MSQIQRRRVVITGLGVLSPIGNDVPTFWQAALRGENGIANQPDFVEAGLTTTAVDQSFRVGNLRGDADSDAGGTPP